MLNRTKCTKLIFFPPNLRATANVKLPFPSTRERPRLDPVLEENGEIRLDVLEPLWGSQIKKIKQSGPIHTG